MKKTKDGYRNAERVMKGVASHRRIEILSVLSQTPERSVSELAEELNIDFRTTSEHIRKLQHAGLIMKRSDGSSMRHAITHLGERMLSFLKTIANE